MTVLSLPLARVRRHFTGPTLTPQQRIDMDARLALLSRLQRGEMTEAEFIEIGQALGLFVDDEPPRTGHMKPARRAAHHVMSREVKGVRPA